MSSQNSIFALSPQNSIVHRGIVPNLFTAAAGSYVSNATYGSGAPAVDSYSSFLVSKNCSSAIRQHDNEVQFDIQIALDCTLAAPAFGVEELRVGSAVPLPTNSSSWAQVLPTPDPQYGLPLFGEVQITLSDTGAPVLSGIIPGILQARLLYGGNLALVAYNPLLGTSPAITAANILGVFGSIIPGQQMLIRIRGTYRGYSSPN